MLEEAEVARLAAGLPPQALLVVDAAYAEFAPGFDGHAALVEARDNVVMTRTFSKIYGLAGLRVGYALASAEVADLMNRVRQPFNVNNLALAAACAALGDADFVAQSYALNRDGMAQILAGLSALGLSHIPSYGNFVTFNAGDGAAVNQKLLQQGVIVRPIGGYGMPEWLRVTIGTVAENARFLEALAKAL